MKKYRKINLNEWGFPDGFIEYNFSLSQQYKSSRTLNCVRCRQNVLKLKEYGYYLQDKVWFELGLLRGVICIGCAEKILGRKLEYSDFNFKAGLNYLPEWPRSKRLEERLQNNISSNAV